MPTTIITGRDISFTISGAQYSAQATSAVLNRRHYDRNLPDTFRKSLQNFRFARKLRGRNAIRLGRRFFIMRSSMDGRYCRTRHRLSRSLNRRDRSRFRIRSSTYTAFRRWNSSRRADRIARLYLYYYSSIKPLREDREHEITYNYRIYRWN
jgi:hypothetical protein